MSDDLSPMLGGQLDQLITGDEPMLGGVNLPRRYQEEYRRFSSAALARLVSAFVRRGLIVVVKGEAGHGFIRERVETTKGDPS